MAMRWQRQSALLGNMLAAVLGLVIALAMAEGAARLMFPRWAEFASLRFMESAPVPGWANVPVGRAGFNGWFSQNNGDFRAHLVINDFGLRDADPVEAADGRIWEVGDSFTFGWGVAIEETFGAVAARGLGLPWYNVASPGTDVCGYRTLLARMPKTVRPKAVLLGLTIENDMLEYDCAGRLRDQEKLEASPRRFWQGLELPEMIGIKQSLTQTSALYNFIAVSVKQVSGLRSLMTGLHIITPIAEERRPFPEERMEAVLDSTAAEIQSLKDALPPGTPLVVVVIPSRLELLNGDSYFGRQREGIIRRLRERGIATADPFERLNAVGMARAHFAHDGHWTALGHRLAGEVAADRLRELLRPSAVGLPPT